MKNYYKDLFDSFLFILLFFIILLFICFATWSIYAVLILNDINILSFWGSIIGGSMTLFGVWWTLKRQEKIRKEDLAVQYKPYLLSPTSSVLRIEDIYSLGIEKGNKTFLNKVLHLQNNGRGEAIINDIKVICQRDLLHSVKIETNIKTSYINTKEQLELIINMQITNIDELIDSKEDIHYIIKVFYTDLFAINNYNKNIEIELATNQYAANPDPSESEISNEFEITFN